MAALGHTREHSHETSMKGACDSTLRYIRETHPEYVGAFDSALRHIRETHPLFMGGFGVEETRMFELGWAKGWLVNDTYLS